MVLHSVLYTVDCGGLPNPTNGYVLLNRFTAIYTCYIGYAVVGAKSRFCQIDGKWSGSTPLCQGMHVMLELG